MHGAVLPLVEVAWYHYCCTYIPVHPISSSRCTGRPSGGLLAVIDHYLILFFHLLYYEDSLQPRPTERNISLNEFIVHIFYSMFAGASYIYSQMMAAVLSPMYSMHSVFLLSVL